MNLSGPWHTADSDDLSWHDFHVHGLRLDNFNAEHGSADLILDIDLILKWENATSGFLFTVCPADLSFHNVFGAPDPAVAYTGRTSGGACHFYR